jgi:hypothetical protein
MARNTRIAGIAALLAVAASVAGVIHRRGEIPPAIALVDRFAGAEKRPVGAAFPVKDLAINGDTRQGISVRADSRLVWRVILPNQGWLRAAIALEPGVWTQEGDGMVFRVGISDGRTYKELFAQRLDPYGNAQDRRWVPVSVDLSAYGGRPVEVIFNTNASLPGKADSRNDIGFWGAPGIYLRP